jgi:hypothetical protein
MNNSVIRYHVERRFNQLNDSKTGAINFDNLELSVQTQYITVKVVSRMLCEGHLQEISELINGPLKSLKRSKMTDYSNATLYFKFRVYADDFEPAMREVYDIFYSFIETYSYAHNLDKLKSRMSFLMDQIDEPLAEGEDKTRRMLRDISHQSELRDLESLLGNLISE